MSVVYKFRKPDHWRDRRYLRLSLLSLAREYDGLLLDRFALDNLTGPFGWRSFEVEREANDLVHAGLLLRSRDASGCPVLRLRSRQAVAR